MMLSSTVNVHECELALVVLGIGGLVLGFILDLCVVLRAREMWEHSRLMNKYRRKFSIFLLRELYQVSASVGNLRVTESFNIASIRLQI